MRSFLKKTQYSTFILFAVAMVLIPKGDCEVVKYDAGGKRDPFVPLIGINRPAASKLENVTSITDVKLEGIANNPSGNLVAILNGEIVKEGDRFGDIQIKKITKTTVTILMAGVSYDKDLTE